MNEIESGKRRVTYDNNVQRRTQFQKSPGLGRISPKKCKKIGKYHQETILNSSLKVDYKRKDDISISLEFVVKHLLDRVALCESEKKSGLCMQ